MTTLSETRTAIIPSKVSLETHLEIAQQRLAAKDVQGALSAAIAGQIEYPTDPRPKIAIARAHMAANRFAGALLPLQQAEALDPSNTEAWMLLAECYNRRDNWYETERYYQKVLAVDPDNITAIVELEQVLREQRRYGEVRLLLENVRRLLPTIDLAIRTSLAMLDLQDGNLETGFQAYEHRLAGFNHMNEAFGTPFFPRWTGVESLQDKSVLLRFEQGLGDTVQFARYATALKARGANHVTVLCKPLLHRLIATIPAVDAVIAKVEDIACDFEAMMMSMPALLGTKTEADIPGDPYLFVKPEDAAIWTKRLMPYPGPRIGLVWSGELKLGKWQEERMNIRRSIPLDLLRPLFDAKATFVSLQKHQLNSGHQPASSTSLKDFYTPNPIIDFMDDCKDFYDTACLMQNLDLIISVDTSSAHVAGALGKPVWMLSRLDSCWRWIRDRPDTAWYPSMTVYWQDTFFDWRPVLRRLADDLITYCQSSQVIPFPRSS